MNKPVRILLVDDSPSDRGLVIRALEKNKEKHVIREADSRQAVLKALETSWDVIVTDYMLQDLTGLDVIDMVRARGLDTPIIFLTGTGTEEVAIEAMKLGVADYVIKSVKHINRLPATVEHVLKCAETERAKQKAEEWIYFLSSIVEQSSEGMAVVNFEGYLLFVNDAFAAMHGYSPEELLGKHLSIFHTPEQMPYVEKINQLVQETVEFSGEIWHVHRNGTVFPTLMHNSVIQDSAGNKIGIIGTLRDITELKNAEERLKASLKEKEALLQEIYHRVKNNLQVISSLLNLKSKYIKGENAEKVFLDCQNYIRAMALVHEKLYQSEDFAKIGFKDYITAIAKELVRTYYSADPDKVALKFDLDDVSLGIKSSIPCGLVINELITNSLKHAFPEGRNGEIRISLHASAEHNHKTIELVVSDNGIGFPKDLDLNLDKSQGLSLVKGLVEYQLQGKIEFTGSAGTEFRITFKEKKQ